VTLDDTAKSLVIPAYDAEHQLVVVRLRHGRALPRPA
jgi:hypothetical protein